MINGIDHIGIAVKSIDEAMKFWVVTLGLKHLRAEDVPGEKVRVAVLAAGETIVELLEPTPQRVPYRSSWSSAAKAFITWRSRLKNWLFICKR